MMGATEKLALGNFSPEIVVAEMAHLGYPKHLGLRVNMVEV